MVVTCRTEQYRAAVSPQHGQGAALQAAAVQLSTLQFGEVAKYLRKTAGPAEDRWEFLDTLSAGSPVRQALATPLMAGLARTIYNPRPMSRTGIWMTRLSCATSRTGWRSRPNLFHALIPAAYRSPTRGRCTVEQAEGWLRSSRATLNKRSAAPTLPGGSCGKPYRTLPSDVWPGSRAGSRAGLVFGLGSGLVFGLAAGLRLGFVFGLVLGLGSGLELGLVAGLFFCRGSHGRVPAAPDSTRARHANQR